MNVGDCEHWSHTRSQAQLRRRERLVARHPPTKKVDTPVGVVGSVGDKGGRTEVQVERRYSAQREGKFTSN